MLLGGRDTVPLRGAWAVLHGVRRDSGGPVDSVRTDRAGRYGIRLSRVDTSAVYVVSAWHDGLAYFSLPLNVVGRPAVEVEDLLVYPTTTDTPPIRVARRLLTVARPGADGTREVLEILELENTGHTTRITDDTLVPTWAGALPSAAIQFQGGQGDISPDAMARRGDRVAVLGPIPPGRPKQLSYSYVLPAGMRAVTVPIDQWTKELNLLLEDTTAVVTVPPASPRVEAIGVQDIEQRRFAAYRAGPLDGGAVVVITLPPGGFRPQMVLPYVIGLLSATMVAALVWALRRKPLASSPPRP